MTERSARALLQRFGQFADRFADCFSRHPQRNAASQYLDALFNDSERKSMQAMPGRLSDPVSYQALQHFITDAPWEAERLWTRLRAVVPVRTGILALDDTSFPKQGKHSVGVKRQYYGALGKVANCQVAVSTVLLSDQLTWPLSFESLASHRPGHRDASQTQGRGDFWNLPSLSRMSLRRSSESMSVGHEPRTSAQVRSISRGSALIRKRRPSI